MYQELSLTAFLEALRKLCRKGKTGTLFFLTEDGGWGKVLLEAGNIDQFEYKMAQGDAALPLIISLSKVKCYFKSSPPQSSSASQDRQEALKRTEEFFSYFGIEYGLNTPAAKAALDESDAISERTIPSRRKHRVLIADDSALVRTLVMRVLSEAGYTVSEAKNGFEALGQLNNEQPDLLLLDLIMPGIDGYEVLNLVRKNEKFNDLPVLILTSRNTLLDKLRGKLSKSDEYLTKPFDRDVLLRAVQKYLP